MKHIQRTRTERSAVTQRQIARMLPYARPVKRWNEQPTRIPIFLDETQRSANFSIGSFATEFFQRKSVLQFEFVKERKRNRRSPNRARNEPRRGFGKIERDECAAVQIQAQMRSSRSATMALLNDTPRGFAPQTAFARAT